MTENRERDEQNADAAVENLTGAYALDAVSDDERRLLEQHIARSDAVRDEARQLAETAALLADAIEPVAPSAGLKASIFAQLDATPQLPREGADASASAAVSETAAAPAAVPTSAERRARDRWFQRPLVLLASAAAAIALVVGAVSLPTLLGGAPQDPFQVVAAASDAQSLTSTMDDGGQVTLVWSAQLALAAIEVDSMPMLPDTNDYELWFIGEDGARSAGVIRMDGSGDARQQLVGEMHAGESIGITIEPAGGSPAPTTDPILVVATS